MDQVLETRGLVVTQDEIGENQGAARELDQCRAGRVGLRRPRGGLGRGQRFDANLQPEIREPAAPA